MAGTSGGGSGSRGGDNNEERLRKMVVDHLRASELFAIDTRTLQGLASLTAIFGQALQAGLICWGSTKRGGGKEGCRSQGSREEEKER